MPIDTTETTPVVSDQTTTPLSERERITQKYESQYFTPTDSAPVTETTPTTEAPAPVTETPATPDLTSVLGALVSRLEAIEARTTPPTQATPVAETTQEDWLKLLAEGKKADGEKALLSLLGPQIEEKAVTRAMERFEAMQEIRSHNQELQSKNQDILAFQPYIEAAIQRDLAAANAAGKIKSPADYVTVYKQVANTQIENARKIALSFRGDGKQDAATRLREVASSQTLQPNAVNTQREAPKPNDAPVVETAQDYFAKRRQQFERNTGLA